MSAYKTLIEHEAETREEFCKFFGTGNFLTPLFREVALEVPPPGINHLVIDLESLPQRTTIKTLGPRQALLFVDELDIQLLTQTGY